MRFASAILAIIFAGTLWGQKLEPASSAEFCGRCHRAILEAWKTSAHAKAMESPIFQEGLEMTVASLGAGSDRLCLTCHAPLAALIQDASLRQKVTWEGITCDYCHSVRTVSLVNGNWKAAVELSLVKTGPLKDVVAPSHGTQFSAVHTSSLICAPCHEYRNSLGFAVLTTYSEWEKSRYAKEGKDCQSCHMYQVAGAVVDPKIKKTPEAKVNLHQMPGSHSIEQLNKTIKAQMSTSREGRSAQGDGPGGECRRRTLRSNRLADAAVDSRGDGGALRRRCNAPGENLPAHGGGSTGQTRYARAVCIPARR